ncbi:MAG: hypothetical protein ACLFUS_12765 [Candidatus Sumerlaeia bacterium]
MIKFVLPVLSFVWYLVFFALKTMVVQNFFAHPRPLWFLLLLACSVIGAIVALGIIIAKRVHVSHNLFAVMVFAVTAVLNFLFFSQMLHRM